MPEVRIIQNAQAAPGTCLLSGDNEGPFIDTGRNVRQLGGRVYISLKHLAPLLRQHGWRDDKDTEGLREQAASLAEDVQRLTEVAKNHEALVAAVAAFVPDPEPVERVVTRTEVRDPTDEDIQRFLTNNPRVLRSLQPAERGSSEEWNSLYRPKSAPQADPVTVEPEAPPTSDGDADGDAAGPPSKVEVLGTTVDLDEVLSLSVDDILDYAEGHLALAAPLLEREEFLRGKAGKEPRKTLVRGLLEVHAEQESI